MHDFFHDLAENLSKEDCFRVEAGNERTIPHDVRYISISVSDLKEHMLSISEKIQLRSVLFLKPFTNDVNEIFEQLLSKLKKLRALQFVDYNSVKLSKLVGELKHLRYLSIGLSSISELPESLSRLYYLQNMHLGAPLKEVPKNLTNLRKLQHLIIYDGKWKPVRVALSTLANIGNLTSLKTLTQFSVSRENGFELSQLGNLNRLQGDLRIENLENANRADASEAKLCDKKDLESLELVWSACDELRRDSDLEVIEGLQPNNNLKHLSLRNYRAATYPNWFENSVIRNLQSFTLYHCLALKFLPSMFGLSSSCTGLTLVGLQSLEVLPDLPNSITSLKIDACPSLVFSPEGNQKFSFTEETFVRSFLDSTSEIEHDHLKNLFKNDYCMLGVIVPPEYRTTSEDWNTLSIATRERVDEHALQAWWRCNQQRMGFIYGNSGAPKFNLPSSLTMLTLGSCNITDGALANCLSQLPSLTELHLESIMTLTKLPSEHVMRQLGSLKILTIKGCCFLRSLGFLPALVSLEKLEVGFCPCLDMNTGYDNIFPTSLQSLILWICVIPNSILCCNMSCLYDLRIQKCRGLESLSIGRLTSLRLLWLWDCPDLCELEGLQYLPSLQELLLVNIPNFRAESLLETPERLGWQKLYISSIEMLKVLSSNKAFASLKVLFIKECQEEEFTFEGHARIPALRQLSFSNCKIRALPNSSVDFPGLELIEFIKCPEISPMPKLPESITMITIEKCPVLKERCRAPDGPDWPKIAHIPYKRFVD